MNGEFVLNDIRMKHLRWLVTVYPTSILINDTLTYNTGPNTQPGYI